jgi:hypothetical protein
MIISKLGCSPSHSKRGTKEASKCIIAFFTVSHQDRETPLDQLPPIARLNIIADELVSTAYESSAVFEDLLVVLPSMAPGVGAHHLDIEGKTMVSKYRSTPSDIIRRTQNIVKAWVKEKTGMADNAFNRGDWQSHTIMAVSWSQQLPHHFIVKSLHQLLQVGTTVIPTSTYYDPVKYTSLSCPTCKEAQEETYDHLLQCCHCPSHVLG